MVKTAPYGSWKSPITPDVILADSVGLGQLFLDGEDIYWIEGRPQEKGRYVLVRRAPDGTTDDLAPAPFNIRTRVHEYGGGAAAVHGGVIVFSNFADGRLYKMESLDAGPQPLTAEGGMRYADMIFDPERDRIICVREDHTGKGEAVNALVSIDLNGDEYGQVIASGHDFYASPRLSPDGKKLAWITWDHPRMPWDGTELWIADVNADGPLGEPALVAGGPAESIFQPEWSPDGVLFFISDRSGWWNFYRMNSEGKAESVLEMEAEFGLPQWVFGRSMYGFESPATIICLYSVEGLDRVGRLDTGTGILTPLGIPYTNLEGIQVQNGRAALHAASPTENWAIITLNSVTAETAILKRSTDLTIDPAYISEPEPIFFPTEGGLTAYGLFYAPQNGDFTAPEGEKPPLIVRSHGGPTGMASSAFSASYQYWTSRGFAILDVNYGGSAGYGRAYRERLYGTWGVVDVEDCINGAKFLIEQGRVDPDRTIIKGGSAGGYTTLAALAFRDFFKAGASYYGVSDLEALARDTHKFESRYLDQLIGPYPEEVELYHERSPVYHVEGLSCPVIFFQGLEDRVVPPNQAEMMVDALREKGIPVAYVTFEGEQHGFRQAANIKRAMEAELYFYSRVFGFELVEDVEPVEIDNLEEG